MCLFMRNFMRKNNQDNSVVSETPNDSNEDNRFQMRSENSK